MLDTLKNVTRAVDFQYVKGVTVFHTISRLVEYRTVSFPLSRSKTSIVNELKEVYKRYHARGFQVIEVHGDNEFKKVETDIYHGKNKIRKATLIKGSV